MGEEATLIIYEDGKRTGHITESGEIGYRGSDEYVESVLDHFHGGETTVYSTNSPHDGFERETYVESSSGTALFDSVRARLELFESIEVQRDSTEIERDRTERG